MPQRMSRRLLPDSFSLFRSLRIYTLLDYKGGHYIFNQKERSRCQSANDNCLANNGRS